ncbi:MAG: MogA/MoaB family molybdenum cofactor biosynthesis protein [Dehalococcoidia bacterium]|nr:MogA/MoaB family molybdenum cofactor biosynthesis protein [Dehalococcoidia bacterium]
MPTLGILTASDLGSQGKREDTSGQAIREMMTARGYIVVRYQVVPDDAELIRARLREWADSGEVDLVLTTGGTGLSSRDVTPEATSAVIERPVPGLAEAMRLQTMKSTPLSLLSRGVAGTRGCCLIVNLPGSPRGVRECLEVVLPALDHATEVLHGHPGH